MRTDPLTPPAGEGPTSAGAAPTGQGSSRGRGIYVRYAVSSTVCASVDARLPMVTTPSQAA
ncbi:hypothetical protein GCM10010994_34110 [Chelatococcus reniformis]|uniref:Uncharacterized protein n=1 Tax=Chelatococcus reniformis TaxID=1494448 RepID=A0A916UHD4_9HYPH|nr:hypothetical protein GCM10010994_34110 [Chelatococcus reniformis]